MSDQILIWDASEKPPITDSTVLLWQSLSENKNCISVPNLVEKNSDYLKKSYLSWIYNLGEFKFNGSRLIDLLTLKTQFSYWWMTSIAEKFPYTNPNINEAIKLIAFDEWANNKNIHSITLISSNKALVQCFDLWCKKLNISFNFQPIKKSFDCNFSRGIYSVIPMPFKAFGKLLFYFTERWPLRGVGLKEWKMSEAPITFCSYFFNLEFTNKSYKSLFWGDLPDILSAKRKKVNWLHIYIKHEAVPSPSKAKNLIKQFNRSGQGFQNHTTLDAFLDVNIFFRVLLGWFKLILMRLKIGQLKPILINDRLNLLPLLKCDWNESFFGPRAIDNLLYIYLFEAACNALPKQQLGFYLFENQPWEKAFVYKWKFLNHGKIFGIQHTTVLFWDLRYFFDSRTYKKENKLPMPDKIGVNGLLSFNMLLNSGFNKSDLIKLEALRYLYLHDLKKPSFNKITRNKIHLLILGDYLIKNTEQQLKLLLDITKFLHKNVVIVFKPHPYCPIDIKKYPDLNLNMTSEPLKKLLKKCNIVYSSSATSAAAEAYYLNTPVITYIDSKNLNLSPLKGLPSIYFVNSSNSFLNALMHHKENMFNKKHKQKIFITDPNIPRWKELLF